MAGPVAEVLFSTVAAPSWQATLDEIIALVGARKEEDSIWVRTTRPIGGFYEGIGRHFLINPGYEFEQPWAEGVWPTEAEETAAAFFGRSFGLVPDNAVSLAAMVNDPEDHRILGELAIWVAERLGGVIAMGALVLPREARADVFLAERREAPWSVVRPKVEAFTASMPGKAVAVLYQSDRGVWASHVVDAAWLRAWMRHPEFRMIK